MPASALRILLTADPEVAVPPVYYGGIERIVDMLARGLADRGHQVNLLARRGSCTAGSLISWPGTRSDSFIDTARNTAALTRAACGRYDLVHSFSRVAYLTPTLPRSLPKLMTYQRPVTPRSVRAGHAISRGTLWFTAISRWMMRDVAGIGTWRMVYNGVPLSTYTFQSDPGPDAPLVFLGRVEEIKGPHLAIEVALRSGVPLVIAGNIPNEHRAWYDANVAPHVDGSQVRYVGPVDDAQKNKLLGSARAFLMPILWDEPFGIVMAEAMACGTPVLGLRRGSVPEIVDDGRTGFVVDDIDGLVAAVASVGRLDRRACRARAEAMFSDEVIVDQYIGVYHEMLAARR